MNLNDFTTFDPFTITNLLETLQVALIYVGGLLTGMLIMCIDKPKTKL